MNSPIHACHGMKENESSSMYEWMSEYIASEYKYFP